MGKATQAAIRDLLVIRLKATAALHLQLAAASPSGPLCKAFMESGALMLEAAADLVTTSADSPDTHGHRQGRGL